MPSIILTYAYHESDQFAVPFMAHAIFNSISMVIALISVYMQIGG